MQCRDCSGTTHCGSKFDKSNATHTVNLCKLCHSKYRSKISKKYTQPMRDEVSERRLEGVKVHAEEQWRPVVGFPGYDVSDQGAVRSYWNLRDGRHHLNTTPIKIVPDHCASTSKYRMVTLRDENWKRNYRPVHILVLEAFVGPRPVIVGELVDSCHGDGDRMNAKLSNLRWDTRKNNEADKLKHGTRLYGEKHPAAKLSNDEVAQIRKMREECYSVQYIALKFGICESHAYGILRGRERNHA